MKRVDVFSTVLSFDIRSMVEFYFGAFRGSSMRSIKSFSPLPIVLCEQDAVFACIGGRRGGFDAF